MNIDACIDVIDPDLKVAGNKQLWKFNYSWASDYQITGFRIQHPSSASRASRMARKHLIQHLKNGALA